MDDVFKPMEQVATDILKHILECLDDILRVSREHLTLPHAFRQFLPNSERNLVGLVGIWYEFGRNRFSVRIQPNFIFGSDSFLPNSYHSDHIPSGMVGS